MATENLLMNFTEIISILPPHILDKIEALILILKTIGIVFIIYILYLFLKAIIDFRRGKRLKFIEKKVKVIDQKLDILIKEKKKNKKKKNNS
ncbi:MAG: hypothetical protein U9Q73_01690 [Nanoarchaeota archaeon]|nr:hypothetical protein [Nanoarchaeota archaeon]